MSTAPIILFGQVRKAAYEEWLSGTGRSTKLLGTVRRGIEIDDYQSGYYECKWQNSACTIIGDSEFHVPHFCSLGDWAGNVTDILNEFRFDTLPLIDNELYNLVLFRYYTRFMLVVSEMLTDFQDLLTEAFGVKKPRKELSAATGGVIDVEKLLGYINSICKHKVSQRGSSGITLHQCNHHLPFFFEDSGHLCTFSKPLKVGSLKVAHPDGIIVPKLEHLVWAILGGYVALDKAIQDDSAKFTTFIKENGTSLPVI